LPVKVVVFNNGTLGFIELEQKSTGILDFGTQFKNPRPIRGRRLNPLKAHLGQIERIDKHVDHANRVVLVNEIIEAFGQ
jgi:thiamine pyrophosphate-dependent acetolactate synthase large subunit-like protein